MKRKLISIILAVITVLGAVPAVVYAEVIEKFENEQHWNIVKFDRNTTGEKIYDGFANNTNVTPSGDGLIKPYATDSVMLLEKSEIFSYISFDNSMKSVQINNNLNLTAVTDSMYQMGASYYSGGWSSMEALCYATGVAFDPTGCGRKNYVAILGFHKADKWSESAARLYIYNADTKNVVKTEELDMGCFHWMYDNNGNLDLDNVDAGNFFQITAGDYNGDGRDSLVLYDGYVVYNTKTDPIEDHALYQYDYDVEKKTWSLTEIGLYTGYLNKGWYSSGGKGEPNAGAFWSYNENWKMHKALNVCLESGDINGDGIDDLAVVSCTGGLTVSEANSNIAQVETTLSVGFGKKGTSTIAQLPMSEQQTIYDNSTGHTPTAPGVSIGDINGDGENEVVVAGFCNQPNNTAPISLQDGEVVFAYFKASGEKLTLTNSVQTLTDISPISKGDSVRKDENTWQHFSVECVNFDGSDDSTGKKSKDYIFLNGYVYLLDNETGTPKKVSVQQDGKELFSSITTKMYGDGGDHYDIDEVFILSAAVGNFTGSNTGEEQLSLTVGFHVHHSKSGDKSGNAYYLGEVTISKCTVKGNAREGQLCGAFSNGMDLPGGGFYYSEVTNEMVYVPGSKNNSSNYLSGFDNMSFIRVACDVGTDSVIGEYVDTEAFYSDPEVVAVLQAAPYFKELEAGNSSTVYSYSETYGTSTATGYDFTVGFGVCAELETSHFKLEVEETIKSGLSEEFEDSIETTYTTEFEANDLNQVILRRKLYYNYIYKIKTYNGQLPTGMTGDNNNFCITVLRNPSISALTFEQYNAYADAYNKKMQDNGKTASLNSISKTNLDHYHLLNNEGNPGGYASKLTEYGSTAFSMAKDDTWVQLSNASGTISQQFENAVASQYTKTTSMGVEVNIKVMGGASFAGNGAFAGVQASMDYVSTKSSTVSTVNTITTKGTVQGIASDLTKYGFQWQLVGWRASDSYPMFNNSNVLFVGYLVSDVKSLPQPVTDLTESYSGETDSVTLTWTSPTIKDTRPQISDFYIYQDGEHVATVSNTGDGETISYTLDVSDNNTASSTFYVLSYSHSQVLTSLESNVVTSIFSMTRKQTAALITEMLNDVNASTAALEQAIATKASSDDLTAAITALTEAYKAADALLGQEIDEAEVAIDELEATKDALEAALKAADAALQEAIDAVQTNLDSAVADLNAALAAGDQANADALTDATNALMEAYESADAILKSGIDGEISELKAAMEAAHEVLQQAINTIQANLDSAVAGLNTTLTTGDQANADALADAVNALTEAYKSADALLKSDFDSEIANLKAALAASDKENAEALAQAISDMSRQLSEMYDLLATQNNELQIELNSVKDHFNAEIESIRAELSAQKDQQDLNIQTLADVNGEQDVEQHTNKTIAIIGLCVSAVSLLCNSGLIAYSIILRKKTRII